MSWLKRATRYTGRSSPYMEGYYMPKQIGRPDTIYQCPEAPWVFLGGADLDDIRAAEQMAGQPICLRVDVTDKNTTELPGPVIKIPLPEFRTWSGAQYEAVQQDFQEAASRLAQVIQSRRCPIFVHCSAGANRSVSVLAAALTQITGRPVFDILREMKSVRGLVHPHDPYVMMALDYSQSEEDVSQREMIRQNIDMDQEIPEMVA